MRQLIRRIMKEAADDHDYKLKVVHKFEQMFEKQYAEDFNEFTIKDGKYDLLGQLVKVDLDLGLDCVTLIYTIFPKSTIYIEDQVEEDDYYDPEEYDEDDWGEDNEGEVGGDNYMIYETPYSDQEIQQVIDGIIKAHFEDKIKRLLNAFSIRWDIEFYYEWYEFVHAPKDGYTQGHDY